MGLILHMFFQSVLESAFLRVSPSRELFGYCMHALHLHTLPQASERQREGCTLIEIVSRDNLSVGGQRGLHVTNHSHVSHGRSQEFTANPPEGMQALIHRF